VGFFGMVRPHLIFGPWQLRPSILTFSQAPLGQSWGLGLKTTAICFVVVGLKFRYLILLEEVYRLSPVSFNGVNTP
jgi:hypothetical protein